MNNNILAIFLFFTIGNCFAQYHREVDIKPFIDTTYIEFNQIFHLWENYINELSIQSQNQENPMKSMGDNLKSYWSQDEIDNYLFPDLYYAFKSSYGSVYYPVGKEYFLGIVKRDTNLFELKTMFVSPFEFLYHGFPSYMITVPVIKIGDSYKLCNKFTLKKPELHTRKFQNINYYFDPDFKFNDSIAQVLNSRIETFKINFQIDYKEPIIYLVADNLTEISEWFGIDYFDSDYSGGLNRIEGRAIKNSNMILSGGGGENYLHEIIHILLKDIGRGNYLYFEEGMACYFGEHVGHNYPFHANRLKEYLQVNDWIDLSENLEGYYHTADTPHSYQELSETPQNDFISYHDDQTNYIYIIHSVLCEIALRQGGYTKVNEMLLNKAENQNEFYLVIEENLGIKRENVNQYIRDFLNENY